MKRQRRTRKQKGGFWPFTSSSYPTTSWSDWFTNKTREAESQLTNVSNSVSNGVSNLVDSTNKLLSTDIPLTSQTTPSYSSTSYSTPSYSSPSYTTPSYTTGGKKRRMTRKQCGGGEAPVHDIKMAKPTYWIKGGKSRRRKKRSVSRSAGFL
jgi:hypothetical protein